MKENAKLEKLRKLAQEAQARLVAAEREISYRKLTLEENLTVKKFMDITGINDERELTELLVRGLKNS